MTFILPAVLAVVLQVAVPLAAAMLLPRDASGDAVRFLVGFGSPCVALLPWWLALRAARHRHGVPS